MPSAGYLLGRSTERPLRSSEVIDAALRRLGRLIGKIDIQIAAIALSMGNITVVSTDTDFTAVTGLRVENWLAV